MKINCTVLLIMFALACTNETQPETIDANTGCSELKQAFEQQCGQVTFDCPALTACTNPAKFEKMGFEECLANVTNAADCQGALNLTCLIPCQEK